MENRNHTFSEFLNDFRQMLELSSTRLMEIPETASQISRREGEWSPKQIIGHLIDSAANNHQRFVRAQFSDDLVHDGYEQDDWVRVQRYNEAPWSQLIQLWKLYNLHLAHVMAAMPEQELTRVREKHSLDQIAWQTVDKTTPATLEYLVRDYVAHMKSHLNQIL